MIIADDDAAFRSGVRAGLQAAGVVVIAEADNGRDAIDLASTSGPRSCSWTSSCSVSTASKATRRIAQRAPEVAVVLLTSSEDEELGVLGLRAGADGHMVKGLPMAELVEAVTRAAAGQPVLAPAVARRLDRAPPRPARGRPRVRPCAAR